MNEQELLRALANDVEFSQNFKWTWQIAHAAKEFPVHAEAMASKYIALALRSDAEFARLVPDLASLKTLSENSPRHAEMLIQRALSSDAEFSRFFKFIWQIELGTQQFPTHAEAIRSKFIMLVLNSDAEFKKRVADPSDLQNLAKLFPAHAEALIQKVLKDPSFFDSLIRDDNGLRAIKPFCPNIPTIQRANSFQELRGAIKAEMLQKNTQAASAKLAALDRGGFFATADRPHKPGFHGFPPELKEQILRDHFEPKKK